MHVTGNKPSVWALPIDAGTCGWWRQAGQGEITCAVLPIALISLVMCLCRTVTVVDVSRVLLRFARVKIHYMTGLRCR
jgi:hypothetical protein